MARSSAAVPLRSVRHWRNCPPAGFGPRPAATWRVWRRAQIRGRRPAPSLTRAGGRHPPDVASSRISCCADAMNRRARNAAGRLLRTMAAQAFSRLSGRLIRRNLAWHPAGWRLSCGLVILPIFQQESQAMSRYREIAPNEMSPAQKRVHDQIIAGKRGRFGGPFHILIRSPEICEYASKLGEHLRWGTSLPDRLSELAIITTARFWRAQYEWYAHAPLAEKAGVPAVAIEMIRTGGTPVFTDKDEALVYRACNEIFRTQRLVRRELWSSGERARRTGCCRAHRDHRLLHADREHAECVPGRAAG